MSEHLELSQSDKDMAVLNHHVKMLRDHFDSVQIFATRHDEPNKKTIYADSGGGNWYSRFGLVKSWVIMQEEYSAKNGLGDNNPNTDKEEA